MSDRLLSGHAPLDSVLGGGLPGNGISVIMGLPGTGKTIIAQQYAFRNARPGRPAVYFSTASEPLDKIVRFGQHLDFFDRAAVGESVFFEDLGAVAGTGGLGGVTKQIATVLKERRPGLIVIDSFKALHEFADSNGDFRGFLYELAGMLGALAVSSLWVGEYEEAEVGSLAEFAVADAILELVAERTGRREIRFLRVRKLRGSGFRTGQHAYRLSASGLHLFPRLADLPIEAEYELGETRASSGIRALDDLLGSGYWPGASTLVLGPSGAGKTLMGLHFIFNGGRQGEPGVIASLQENKTQLQRVAAGFGWSLDEPYVEMMYRSPVDIYIDEWVYELIQIVEQTRARRVLIDSLADLRLTATEETRFQEFTYSLVQRFSQKGISVMMTLESPELFHPERLSDSAVSHISDNVVLLSYVQEKNLINRAMTVIKSRASHHDPAIRQFRIGPHGIVLADTSLSPTDGGTALSIRLRSALQQCTADRYWGPAGSHDHLEQQPHTPQTALTEHEQGRAGSLHPYAQPCSGESCRRWHHARQMRWPQIPGGFTRIECAGSSPGGDDQRALDLTPRYQDGAPARVCSWARWGRGTSAWPGTARKGSRPQAERLSGCRAGGRGRPVTAMLVGEMSEGAQETPGGRFGPQAAVEEQGTADEQPDVLLDVRELKVDEIHLEVDDLQAHVSLLAEVLTLLKLQVGADVSLAKVSLDIKGVEAVAVLKVRLDNVAAIIDRVMTTIDNNPQIIADLTGGLGAAAGELGQGAGEAVEEAGQGAGRAVEGIGKDAGSAAQPAGGVIGHMVGELARDGGETDQRSRRSGPRG